MEKTEILAKTKQMKTVEDLATLLNEIKQDEFHTCEYPVTKKQLFHFCNSKIVADRYKTFQIRKKSGGTREISKPIYQLGIILHLLNILFKSIYTPGPSAMGFAEGRSIVDNARTHVGHNYVLNIDLENFFPSVPQARIWGRLQCPPFNFTKEIANVVAGLCCNANADKTKNVLPQGASTSPLLVNAICDKLDKLMRDVAKRYGLHYSRYADDMTFSSMHNVYQKGGEFMTEIKQIIEGQGFKMNDKKTRLLRDGQRQEVTGLTVNSCINVARKYTRDLRCILHVWETEGYSKAYSYFYPHYKHEKGYIKKGEPIMENVIGGKLNYLRMVKGDNNVAYQKLLKRYNNLQQIVYVDNETDKGTNYIYVQPYTIKEFEDNFGTKVTLEISKNKKLTGKCTIAGMEKYIAISKSTQDYLCKDIVKHQAGEEIVSQELKNTYVTLCRRKGKNFWLNTMFEPKRDKCLSFQNVTIDIDVLLETWGKGGVEVAAQMFKKTLMDENVMESKKLDSKDKKDDKSKSSFGTLPNSVSSNVFKSDSVFDDSRKAIEKIAHEELSHVVDDEAGIDSSIEDFEKVIDKLSPEELSQVLDDKTGVDSSIENFEKVIDGLSPEQLSNILDDGIDKDSSAENFQKEIDNLDSEELSQFLEGETSKNSSIEVSQKTMEDPCHDEISSVLDDEIESESFSDFIEYSKSVDSDEDDNGSDKKKVIKANEDIKNLIYFILHNKSLTRQQIKKRDLLLAKDYSNLGEHSDNIILENVGNSQSRIHDKKRVAEFLHKFTEETTLKYSTHLWDLTSNEGELHFKNFDDFLHGINKDLTAYDFFSREDKQLGLYNCCPNLYYIIKDFLISKDIKDGWGKDKLKIGFNCPEGIMKKWMEQHVGMQPFEMPISEYPSEITPKRILKNVPAYFSDVRNEFKKCIEFRDDDLADLIEIVFHSANYSLNKEELTKMKGQTFYTDTNMFRSALEIVAENLNNRTKYPEVTISCRQNGHDVEICVCQKDSFSNKDLNDDKLTLKAGQLRNIKNKLISLCDFSIESRFMNNGKFGFYRIDYLYNSHADASPKISEIDYCNGFKYIFNFYKV